MSIKFIDIERDFTDFVRTFRRGVPVRDLVPDAPNMTPNADFFFSDDDVIAELKCLRVDLGDRERTNNRFWTACERLGYSPEHALLLALRQLPLPSDVARDVVGRSMGHLRKALHKAGHQIASTKLRLNRPEARGLVIMANENNPYLTPEQMLTHAFQELRTMPGAHIDGLVYTTPNFYYPLSERDPGLYSLWLPSYRRADPRLSSFVDGLGAAWSARRLDLDAQLVGLVGLHEPPLSDFNQLPESVS